MTLLAYQSQLTSVHFRRVSWYVCRSSALPGRRIARLRDDRLMLSSAEETTEFCSFHLSLNCHGASRSRIVCKFEEDNKEGSSMERIKEERDNERPPFDINLAVVLAGFAFEAYNTPSDNGRVHETDPFGCKTIYLLERFVREVYDGKVFISLKRGSQFPGLDLWGTSDIYVVLRIGESVVCSKTIWATTAPVWNQQFEINVKDTSKQFLQVAAWDANLVTEDRRLGNSGVNLEHISDGEKHDVTVELEGMGGGGLLNMEIQYKSFEVMDMGNKGWSIPILSDLFQGKKLDDLFKSTFGLESLTVRDFLGSVLGNSKQQSDDAENVTQKESGDRDISMSMADTAKSTSSLNEDADTCKGEVSLSPTGNEGAQKLAMTSKSDQENILKDLSVSEMDVLQELSKHFSEAFGLSVDNFGLPLFDALSWDALDIVKKLGLESKKKAESHYVDNGLAIMRANESTPPPESVPDESSILQVEDVQKASSFLLKHTEEILKSWAVLASSLTGQAEKQGSRTIALVKDSTTSHPKSNVMDKSGLSSDEQLQSTEELEELRKMFDRAESAMEAWAVLASSLGHKSFVKSAFEKLCFLDNDRTDTQVALWRDPEHRRLLIAYRGTEQVRWKDLRTDLMLLPVSFNPERVGGTSKDEAQVHGGFLGAYDSVRSRLKSLVKAAIGISNQDADAENPWQVYVTGHSLGGALATLAALELSTSWLARHGHIKVTMYNFGSPRVGNKNFADRYNQIVKDSWRVVNHLDIIPTVPRLMGYSHVATPIYLTAGDVQDATVNMELLKDGYNGDVIGEATPDFLLEEFMKGEKRLIERLLQTEIAMIQSIRNGSALMQHMEDFYYISLLERVRPKLRAIQSMGDTKSDNS